MTKQRPAKADFRVPTPAELKEELDKHVIGQEHAKRVLSVAVHNHYKRLFGKQDGGKNRRRSRRTRMLKWKRATS